MAFDSYNAAWLVLLGMFIVFGICVPCGLTAYRHWKYTGSIFNRQNGATNRSAHTDAFGQIPVAEPVNPPPYQFPDADQGIRLGERVGPPPPPSTYNPFGAYAPYNGINNTYLGQQNAAYSQTQSSAAVNNISASMNHARQTQEPPEIIKAGTFAQLK